MVQSGDIKHPWGRRRWQVEYKASHTLIPTLPTQSVLPIFKNKSLTNKTYRYNNYTCNWRKYHCVISKEGSHSRITTADVEEEPPHNSRRLFHIHITITCDV